ncbi:hypothetical protein H1R20_g10695, partial [Candolleomyces eurysporus]
MAAQDRGYTLLLNHLHNPNTTLAPQTIQGALSHHLATLSPLPTPLAATAISSPYFISQPLTYNKLNTLSTAFRHAVHLKFTALSKEEEKLGRLEGLFKQSLSSAMDTWVKDVVRGLQGGDPVLRLASCNGLLLGVEDVRLHARNPSNGSSSSASNSKETATGTETAPVRFEIPGARGVVEDEDIVALAEVMDAYAFSFASGASAHGVEEWEKEFQPAGQDLLSMALIFASQSFPLIPQDKLKVLPLPMLSQILTSTICATFKSGTFLSSVSASVTLTPDNRVHISPSSAFAQTIHSIKTSPLTASISSIARFTANVLALLLDLPSSHLDEHMRAVEHCLEALRDMAKKVERDWISTSLASVSDAEIAPDTKALSKSVWSILKTLLFTIIMVSDSALSAAVYIPPPAITTTIIKTNSSHQVPSSSSFALETLYTLSHLAFVISQFGGVTSTSSTGFKELKKTFYLALDILASPSSSSSPSSFSDALSSSAAIGSGGEGEGGSQGSNNSPKAEAYVEEVCRALKAQKGEGNVAFRQAKEAFALASIEQLVPVLGDECIRNWVWGVCYPHLFDASHRETFESAHSTVLAIFACHAQQQQQLQQSQRSYPAQCLDGNGDSADAMFAWFNKVRSMSPGQQLRDRAAAESDRSGPSSSESRGRSNAHPRSKKRGGPKKTMISTEFVKMLVPFYAGCLVDNSVDGKLTTPQLRMAYTALVRSACASATAPDGVGYDETFSLAWYCVQLLLDTLSRLTTNELTNNDPGKGKGKGRAATRDEDTSPNRVHRLHLTLISTLSALPLKLLGKALEEVYKIIITVKPTTASTYIESTPTLPSAMTTTGTTTKRKRELVEALFGEILEGMGDREKGYAMAWWYEHRAALLAVVGDTEGGHHGVEGAAAKGSAEDGEPEKAKTDMVEKVGSSSRARL